MTPAQLAKSDTEHAHQRAFFAWLALAAYHGFDNAKRYCEEGVRLHSNEASPLPELHLFHAIPNGGARDKSTAGKLKAEGVKPGVLDTFLPVPKPYTYPVGDWRDGPGTQETAEARYKGLYVEFKEPKRRNHKDGGLSDDQIKFGDAVREQGYCVRVAYTWQEAANAVMLYYGVDTRFDTT